MPAIYLGDSLFAEIDPAIPVRSVVAAAELVLEQRGYTITAAEATADRGRVVARPSDPRLGRKVTVTARLGFASTNVAVNFNPGGNEAISRDIFERILTRLGS